MLAALVVVLGAGPFLAALRATDLRVLAIGVVVAVVTTVAAAWRWRLVARRLGAELDLRCAVAACYRAQFLNSALPGGVLGDVGRGLRHGRDGGDVARGLRGVAWERAAGQVVLLGLTAVVLLVTRPFDPSRGGSAPWSGSGPLLGVAAVALALVVAVILLRRDDRRLRWWQLLVGDVRALLSGPASAGLVLASVVVVAGHVATFVVAARAVGVAAPVRSLVPLALVVLVVGALPVNLAGWGPREGAAAWAFAAAGLGASQGLATSVVFGAVGFVATLPGAALLLLDRVPRPARPSSQVTAAPLAPVVVGASRPAGGASHG